MSDENADAGRGDRNGRDRTERTERDREALGYTDAGADGEGAGGNRATDRDRDDEKMVGTDPDADPIDEPTTESGQASRETRWVVQESLAIGIVSIVAGVLIAFGLMQATGLVELPGPLANSAIAHWSLFVALGVITLAAFAYSQRGT